MDIVRLADLQYARVDDPQRKYDFYIPVDEPSKFPDGMREADLPVIIFVHGGAWRSEDKHDHRKLAEELARRTHACVAVPNYRLSPRTPPLHHPAHAEDVLTFLTHLHDVGCEFVRDIFSRSRWYLVGHSCSAHMIASIVLNSDGTTPSLAPPARVLDAIRGVAFSEGIYDIDLLLARWPDYGRWFIHDAFGEREEYSAVSIARYPLRKPGTRWLLMHSCEDELVDPGQTKAMGAHLQEIHADQEAVTIDIGGPTEKHDDVLKGEYYLRSVSRFVLDIERE
ncbi:Alpha/Beta hydrolase protein [Schizophyllum amplum]|uniref:Alpha/Beta hydrolase protein n=1 Tax=Schizophyllum amplum TaxID=97359 RepID=A0A550BRW7_9AGAR|nr:Alpha/Beta hydrolase protein [Auriculariopsis ampla]TRM61909.1 Alpha/Beta hydrolase protein [Auriculariopsis ampla]